MTQYLCSCKCSNIKFMLSQKPIEIARCYCSICVSLSQQSYMSFAKCDLNIVSNVDKDKLKTIKKTAMALRYYCSQCNDPIYMHYKNSDNVWINADIFQFDHHDIETYDIYK